MFYRWKSEALQAYSSGDIIIHSDYGLDNARIQAIKAFESWLKSNREWVFYEEDEEELKEYRHKFFKDIDKEPEKLSTLLIEGSD